eukprot:TRINITY_DN52057_c0_g1_i1.p1 TRINITY_DN52057_c0_g1~~TRINITY_DN52057_c0_g1_i1.p1  ORF type:complete len:307 (-),score=14.48 TRINITY_DN52057_c0_g1_i1:483-1403(-)
MEEEEAGNFHLELCVQLPDELLVNVEEKKQAILEAAEVILSSQHIAAGDYANSLSKSSPDEEVTKFNSEGIIFAPEWQLSPQQLTTVQQTISAAFEHTCARLKELGLQEQLGTLGLPSCPYPGYDEYMARSTGRIDMVVPQLSSLDFLNSDAVPWYSLVQSILGPDTRCVFKGCVIGTPGCETQDWHKDGKHLWPIAVTNDAPLPPHCLNVFVPLVDITEENGPTEFQPTSHKHEDFQFSFKTIKPCLKAGQCLLFDYRLWHRGLANTTNANRPLLYLTYARSWYRDPSNFPGRSCFTEHTPQPKQ